MYYSFSILLVLVKRLKLDVIRSTKKVGLILEVDIREEPLVASSCARPLFEVANVSTIGIVIRGELIVIYCDFGFLVVVELLNEEAI